MKFIINEAVQLNPPIAMIILPAASKSCWHNVPPANTKTSSAATRITAVSSKLFIINLLKNNKFGKETKMDSSEKFSVTVNGEMIINSKGDITDNMQSTEESVEVDFTGSATTSNNSLLNVDTLSVIAVIVAVASFFITVCENANKEKKIVYKVKNINTHSSRSCTRFTFWNISKEILSGSDFSEENYIAIKPANENTTIETINIVAEYKKGYCNLEKTVSNSNECRFKFDKIGYRQGFTVDVIHTGNGKKDLVVSGSTPEYDVEKVSEYFTAWRVIIFIGKLIATFFAILLTAAMVIGIILYPIQAIPNNQFNILVYIMIILIAILFYTLSVLLVSSIYSYFVPKKELKWEI